MQGQSTFWAPDVFKHKDTYYMIVTFIPGIHPFWGGDARACLLQKQGSDELGSSRGNRRYTWLYRRFGVSDAGTGTWKMWYKTPDSKTNTGVSKDLTT